MRGLVATVMAAALVVACSPTANLTPDQIVAAFIAASQSPARTMNMQWQATQQRLTSNEPGLYVPDPSFSAAFGISGLDYEGALHPVTAIPGASTEPERQTILYARVDGVGFVSNPALGGGWQRTTSLDMGGGDIDPLRGLTAGAVMYESSETVDGRNVHVLRVRDPVAALDGLLFTPTFYDQAEPVLDGQSEFVVYVDDSGTPISAQLVIDIGLKPESVNGRPPSKRFQFEYEFSNWGEPLTITAPQVVASPTD